MKLGNILNQERINALSVESNAYNSTFKYNDKKDNSKTQFAEKVIFPEGYENANQYYNKNEFTSKKYAEENNSCPHCSNNQNNRNNSSFSIPDIKSLLPMLMSGKFNNFLNPLMSMLGGNKGGAGSMDFAKIFDLFKPKNNIKKEDKKQEEVLSKFDDFVIIED